MDISAGIRGGNTEGVYFSPQQMIGYSRIDRIQCIFPLGLMLVEIVFGENLSWGN
jgi:hypothetical protein